jgi:SH3 domain protein
MHPIFSSNNFIRIILLFLCITCAPLIQAESVYVDDRLRVGVRKETGNRVAPHAIVYTGMKLEILEEAGNFIRIKTEKGIEGWIKKTYVTPERPAKELLAELKKSHDKLRTEYETLQKQGGGSNNNGTQLKNLQSHNNELRQQLEKLSKKLSNLTTDTTGAKQIQELQKQNEMLEEQIMEMTSSSDTQDSSSPTAAQHNPWLPSVMINVLMMLAGFSAGFLWFRRQMIRRLEGAEN